MIYSNFLESVGNTPLIKLRKASELTGCNILGKAEFLITDGGSNQEECFYLGTPCLLFRSETERSEGIGENVIVSNFDPTIIENFVLNYNSYRRQPIPAVFSPSRFIVDQLV